MNTYEVIAYRTERLTCHVVATSVEEAERLWRLGLSTNETYSEPTEWEIDETHLLQDLD